jgi:hypothetical protein
MSVLTATAIATMAQPAIAQSASPRSDAQTIVAQQEQPYPTHVPLNQAELEIWKHEQVMGRTDKTRDDIIKMDDLLLSLRRATCDVAIGHDQFCECLNKFLPIRMTLVNYVKFALGIEPIKTADGKTSYKFDKSLGYSDEEERAAFAARATCIVTSFKMNK